MEPTEIISAQKKLSMKTIIENLNKSKTALMEALKEKGRMVPKLDICIQTKGQNIGRTLNVCFDEGQTWVTSELKGIINYKPDFKITIKLGLSIMDKDEKLSSFEFDCNLLLMIEKADFAITQTQTIEPAHAFDSLESLIDAIAEWICVLLFKEAAEEVQLFELWKKITA